MTATRDIFKAYDIRGLYPTELDEAIAEQIGRGLRDRICRPGASRSVATCDSPLRLSRRRSSTVPARREQTSSDYGMISTDMMYYAVIHDELDGGAQITASHNPKQYNGVKLVGRLASPLSGDAGISDIRDLILSGGIPTANVSPGSVSAADVLDRYVPHVMSFIEPEVIKPLRLVLDAGSGMAGLVAPRLFERLPCRTTRLCFDIDGTFPVHEANPLIEANRRDLTHTVVTSGADAGIAWDGDADRCFFVDGDGAFVPGDFITALLAESFPLEATRINHRVRRARQPRRPGCRCGPGRQGLDEPRRPRVLQEAHARGQRRLRR